jgi:hypothetical protein
MNPPTKPHFRTGRTGISNSRMYAGENLCVTREGAETPSDPSESITAPGHESADMVKPAGK